MQPNSAANSYMRTRILTASPQELRLMLYDGAIKFTQQARQAVLDKRIEDSYNSLMRAQKIVLELSTSLRPDVDPQLCDKLNALYTYIYRLLIEANLHKQVKPIDEALKLLEYEKDTWKMLMDKAVDEARPAQDPGGLSVAGAQQTAISSLSING